MGYFSEPRCGVPAYCRETARIFGVIWPPTPPLNICSATSEFRPLTLWYRAASYMLGYPRTVFPYRRLVAVPYLLSGRLESYVEADIKPGLFRTNLLQPPPKELNAISRTLRFRSRTQQPGVKVTISGRSNTTTSARGLAYRFICVARSVGDVRIQVPHQYFCNSAGCSPTVTNNALNPIATILFRVTYS